MKYIVISILLGFLLFISCSPEDVKILNNSVDVKDIIKIELRADHKTLIPLEGLKMDFHVLAYSSKEFVKYDTEEKADTLYFKEETIQDTFLIPADMIPEGFIKVYDESGKELKDMSFSTTDTTIRTYHFQAKAGDLVSNVIDIQTRKVPQEDYPEVVYPVIFHVIVPPASAGPSYEVSSQDLQAKLDRMNNIFNRLVTTNPNGGNIKIKFCLAEYDNKGNQLLERGKNLVQLTEKLANQKAYEAYINQNLIWDPNKYLNIWLAKFSGSWNSVGTYTYVAKAPTVILRGNSIPGISAKAVDKYTAADVTAYSEVGVMMNYSEFLSPNSWTSNTFEPAMAMGLFFGLNKTKLTKNPTGIGYDNDYCPDTYYYYDDSNVIYKSTSWDEDQEDPVEYFTSFNIMEDFSRKNSITADQASRMRQVIEKCPSRWSYKSQWAFTGKD